MSFDTSSLPSWSPTTFNAITIEFSASFQIFATLMEWASLLYSSSQTVHTADSEL